MRKNVLARVITVGLLLGSLNEVTEAALVNGTHDIGGTINVSGNYATANGSLILNAIGDTTFKSPNSTTLVINGNNSSIVLNANNHDITDTGYGQAIYFQSKYSNGDVEILNAKNINFTWTGSGNTMLVYGKQQKLVLEANKDINITNPYAGNPTLSIQTVTDSATVSIKAGHDINWNTKSNGINVHADADVTLTAGNDIKFTGGSYPPIISMNNANLKFVAGHDFIADTVSNPLQAKYGGAISVLAANDINIISSGKSGGLYFSEAGTTVNMAAQNGSFSMVSTNGNTGALIAEGGANVTVTAAKDVTIGGVAQRAIRSRGGSTVNITAGTEGTITLEATTTSANNNAVIYVNSDSTVNLHSDTVLDGVTDSIRAEGGTVTFDKGMVAENAANVIVASDSAVITGTNTTAAKKLKGDISVDGTGTSVDLVLPTADSYFTGASLLSDSGTNSMEFANGATWNMTASSDITDLVMKNNAVLNMNYTGTGTYEKVRVHNLTGTDGHIMLSTDLQSSKDTMNVQAQSDRIKIIDGSDGTYVVDIADASALTGVKAEGYLLIIEDAYWKDKDYNNLATFVGGNLRKGGIFKYRPIITNVDPDAASGYSGVTTDQKPTPNCGGHLGGNPPCDNPDHVWTKQSWYLTASEKTKELTDSIKSVLGSAGARYMSYWQELDTMLMRMGELRNDENAQGIWVRYRRGEQEISNVGLLGSTYNLMQLGYDYQTSKDKQGNRNMLGLAFHHTWGDQEYVEGATGESGANVFTIYDTWLGNKGHYWDVVGKVGRQYKDFSYPGDDYLNVPDSGDSGGYFYSIGMEYGRKAYLGDAGWYAEPQAQLTYGHINGIDFTTDQKVNVTNSAVNSLIGRIGFTLGKEFKGWKNNKTNIYGKLFWSREFKGGMSTHMIDSYGDTYAHDDDYSGNWGTFGFGITSKLNNKQDIYLDFEKSFGGLITTKWQFNGGLRWKF